MDSIQIRKAEPRDAEAIAAFNQAMARETEHKMLIPEVVTAGVNALLEDSSLGFYIVAEANAAANTTADANVVASLMVTMEWSDWRNGLFWWIQSVFVEPGYRRRGIYRQMYGFVKTLAESESNVCGFRLYVERDNIPAQRTYTSLGMEESPYLIFEALKPW